MRNCQGINRLGDVVSPGNTNHTKRWIRTRCGETCQFCGCGAAERRTNSANDLHCRSGVLKLTDCYINTYKTNERRTSPASHFSGRRPLGFLPPAVTLEGLSRHPFLL